MKTIPRMLLLALVVSFSGCKPSEAEALYEMAVLDEPKPYGDRSFHTIEAYREVIRFAPKSSWAEKSQRRIDATQANISSLNRAWSAQESAEEARRTRKAVEFHYLLNQCPLSTRVVLRRWLI